MSSAKDSSGSTPVRVPLRALDENLRIAQASPEMGAGLRASDRNRRKSSSTGARAPLGCVSTPPTSTAQARVRRGKENAAPGVVDIQAEILDDDRLVPGNLPAMMEIGKVGSCIEAQWQPRPRRKQGAVIVKPPVEPPKRVHPCGVLGELRPGVLRGIVRDAEHVKLAMKAIIDPSQERRLAVKECEPLAGDSDMFMTRGPDFLTAQSSDDERIDMAEGDIDQNQPQDTDDNLDSSWMDLMRQDLKGRISSAKRMRRVARKSAVIANVFAPLEKSIAKVTSDPQKRRYALQMATLQGLFIETERSYSREITRLEDQAKQLEDTPCSCPEA